MSDPLAAHTDPVEVLRWAAGLWLAHPAAGAVEVVTAIADAIESGEETDIPVPEPLLGYMVESIRALAEDPDTYFIDADGPMQPRYRYYPDAVLQVLHADIVSPPDDHRALRRSARENVKR